MKLNKTRAALFLSAASFAALGLAGAASAETLRLLTWGGYAPEDVVEHVRGRDRPHASRSRCRTTRK